MIDPKNAPSQNVAAKFGFTYWKQAVVNGYLDNLYRARSAVTTCAWHANDQARYLS